MKPSKPILIGILSLLSVGTPFNASIAMANAEPRLSDAYRPATGPTSIPFFFEENVGQTDESVRFVGRGQAYSVLVTDSEAVFKLPPAGQTERGADVRMQWLGGNVHARATADSPLPGKSNYLIGNDPSAWKTSIPTYGKVRHAEVYPGVDLEFYGKGDQLEYDVVVRPGADPAKVLLRFAGAERVSVDDESGDLVLAVPGGELRHQKAIVYQPTATGKRSIESHYRVTPDGDVAFDVGEYDPSQLLVIDPVVTFIGFVGGSQSEDYIAGMNTDASGGVYVTGHTTSLDLDPLPPAYDTVFNGGVDAFVMKFNSATGAIVYSTYLGSTEADHGTNVAVDGMGNAFVIGITNSSLFPTTSSAYRQTYAGETDGFVCKLAPNGSSLAYSTFLGGSGSDVPYDIAVDETGRAIIVGSTTSSNMETFVGAFDRSLDGSSDGFALKLSASGGALVQATYLGGSHPDQANAVGLAVGGDILIAGDTGAPDFPTSVGAFDRTFDGVQDEGFVTRLASSLNSMVYSTLVGKGGEEKVRDIDLSATGQVSFVGSTTSSDMPVTPNAPQPMYGGDFDGYVGRISTDGSTLEFLTYQGGLAPDICEAVTTDTAGNAYIAGSTYSGNFPTTVGAYDSSLDGFNDAFVAKYLASGQLALSTLLGGNGEETAVGIGIAAMGRIVVAGNTGSSNFPTTVSGRLADGNDGFVTTLTADGSSIVHSQIVGGSIRVAGGTQEIAKGVASAPDGAVYVVGETGSVNFPKTPGGIDPDSDVGDNGFLVRLDSTGRTLLSSTVFGGSLGDFAEGIALAPDGDVIVTGYTSSSDFPTSANCLDPTLGSPGVTDAFLIRVSADCALLRYGTYLGGVSDDYGSAVAVDSTGAAYVTGTTNSTDFPTTPGAFDNASSSSEAFATKLDAAGATILYSTYLGGSGSELGVAIVVDNVGRACVTGQTYSTNFPTTPGAYSTVHNGEIDLFVTMLSANGTAAVFSTFLGGSGSEQPGGIVIDAVGNVVIAGATNSSSFPTTAGAFDTTFNGGFVDAFVTGISPTGSQLAFSSFYGGTGADVCFGLARDSNGRLWACGFSFSVDLPLTPNAFDSTTSGKDGFAVAFDTSAASITYATMIGGSNDDALFALTIDTNDAVTLVGQTTSLDLAPDGFGTDDGSSALIIRLVPAADTPALYIPPSGAWFLRYTNTSGIADSAFSFGAGGSGLLPLAGNWDGAAGDSPGLYDPATGAFFLRNSNSPGPADVVFTFGPGGPDFVPLAGDWNGDGTDTVGIYSQSTGAFFLRNVNAGGPADLVFSFGPGGVGFTPIAGDWNGDGTETIGIYQVASGAFFLRNSNSNGSADLVFTFGSGGAGFVPVTGDWNGDGTDTIGIRLQSSGVFFLRDSNSAGPADSTFGYGAGGETPVVGNWAG